MLTAKRTILDDDRQGGYTTTVNRPAAGFNFSESRAPRADVSGGCTEYERDRIDAMRAYPSAGAGTETAYTQRTAKPRRAYTEEELMPSIETMQTAKASRAKRASVARRIEIEPDVSRENGEKKGLSQNAKLLIAVYAVIVFIALVLIIASGIAVNKQADKASKLEGQASALQAEVTAQAYFIANTNPSADGYEPIDGSGAVAFAVKPLSEKTEYKAQTNAFDRFCDFFSWLWGG